MEINNPAKVNTQTLPPSVENRPKLTRPESSSSAVLERLASNPTMPDTHGSITPPSKSTFSKMAKLVKLPSSETFKRIGHSMAHNLGKVAFSMLQVPARTLIIPPPGSGPQESPRGVTPAAPDEVDPIELLKKISEKKGDRPEFRYANGSRIKIEKKEIPKMDTTVEEKALSIDAKIFHQFLDDTVDLMNDNQKKVATRTERFEPATGTEQPKAKKKNINSGLGKTAGNATRQFFRVLKNGIGQPFAPPPPRKTNLAIPRQMQQEIRSQSQTARENRGVQPEAPRDPFDKNGSNMLFAPLDESTKEKMTEFDDGKTQTIPKVKLGDRTKAPELSGIGPEAFFSPHLSHNPPELQLQLSTGSESYAEMEESQLDEELLRVVQEMDQRKSPSTNTRPSSNQPLNEPARPQKKVYGGIE